MSTSALLERVNQYSVEIQKRTRAQQLVWFGERFGIAPEPLLRLLGYTPKTIREKLSAGETIEELAEKKSEETIWMTEIFREMVHRNGYDVDRLAKSLAVPLEEMTSCRVPPSQGGKTMFKVTKGVLSLLRRKVRAGGPQVYDDLTEYLRFAKSVPEGARKTPKSRPQGSRRNSHPDTTTH